MISTTRIFPPENWRDFEHLTLKLWGEIWNVPDEIEFNSESGSKQKGVDIYCVPKKEKGYFGIQCKNTKLFCKYGKINKLTKATIDQEIEKAKEFKPKLEKLIIATSFGKDGELEEYVRTLNLIHIDSGLFRIQLCFWDYFSRKIVEYESVYNWYLKNQNFENSKSVVVSFENNNLEIVYLPEYIRNNITYRLQTEDEKTDEKRTFLKAYEKFANDNKSSFFSRIFYYFSKKSDKVFENKTILINGVDIRSEQYIESTYPKRKNEFGEAPRIISNLIEDTQQLVFKIKIKNDGRSVIEDFKLSFQLEGQYQSLEVRSPRISQMKIYNATTWITNKFGLFEPLRNFIIQKDFSISKEIILTPNIAQEGEVKIKWTFLARDFNDEGELLIKIRPKFIEKQSIMYVLKKEDCKTAIEYCNKMKEGILQINW